MIPVAVLLGNTNSPEGVLSPIAQARCAVAAQLATDHPDLPFILTGAFGAHFNTSDRPHWHYLAEELRRLGVSESRILAGTSSANTREDAFATRDLLQARWGPAATFRLHLVTSAFHLTRVKFLFAAALPGAVQVEHPAPDPGDAAALAALRRHEARALRQLRANPRARHPRPD